MTEIADRYRRRADAFEALVVGVRPDQWGHPSPCVDWDARGVVGHIVGMHDFMLRPLGRALSAAPTVDDDPVAAYRSARADVEAILDSPTDSAVVCDTPMGPTTAEAHIDGVVSADLVLHGWDLARATGQDDTIDPDEVDAALPGARQIPDEMRIPEHFGPGIVVFGPEVPVGPAASPQDQLLGLLGRDPHWTPSA